MTKRALWEEKKKRFMPKMDALTFGFYLKIHTYLALQVVYIIRLLFQTTPSLIVMPK